MHSSSLEGLASLEQWSTHTQPDQLISCNYAAAVVSDSWLIETDRLFCSATAQAAASCQVCTLPRGETTPLVLHSCKALRPIGGESHCFCRPPGTDGDFRESWEKTAQCTRCAETDAITGSGEVVPSKGGQTRRPCSQDWRTACARGPAGLEEPHAASLSSSCNPHGDIKVVLVLRMHIPMYAAMPPAQETNKTPDMSNLILNPFVACICSTAQSKGG